MKFQDILDFELNTWKMDGEHCETFYIWSDTSRFKLNLKTMSKVIIAHLIAGLHGNWIFEGWQILI